VTVLQAAARFAAALSNTQRCWQTENLSQRH